MCSCWSSFGEVTVAVVADDDKVFDVGRGSLDVPTLLLPLILLFTVDAPKSRKVSDVNVVTQVVGWTFLLTFFQ